MAYTVVFTSIVTPGEVFYADTSPQAQLDSDALALFRTQQPGYVSQTVEVVSATTRKLTVTFDTQESFDAYIAAMKLTEEYLRRVAYYDSIDYTLDEEVIPPATPT